MGGYKALILLVWLAVPATGYYLLRQDYVNYVAASRAQRTDCEKRINVLLRYTKLMSVMAGQVETIYDADSRAVWQRRWRDLKREHDDLASGLRLVEPAYYPRTDQLLLQLERLLSEQREAIEHAAREQDAYNKGGGDLEERALKIQLDRGTAEYYRAIGAYGIYELIKADVDRQEEEFKERLRERNRVLREIERALTDAAQLRSDILDGLDRSRDALDEDEGRSYQLELRTRFDQFNLREELRRLILGDTPPR